MCQPASKLSTRSVYCLPWILCRMLQLYCLCVLGFHRVRRHAVALQPAMSPFNLWDSLIFNCWDSSFFNPHAPAPIGPPCQCHLCVPPTTSNSCPSCATPPTPPFCGHQACRRLLGRLQKVGRSEQPPAPPLATPLFASYLALQAGDPAEACCWSLSAIGWPL